MGEQTVKIILQFQDNASAGVRTASAAIGGALGKLSSGAVNSLGSIQTGFGGLVTGVQRGTSLLTGHLNNLVNHMKWASLFIGAALSAVAIDALNSAAKFEQFGKATVFLTGSTEAAKQFAASVRTIALNTQFTIDQIADMEMRLVGNTRNIQFSERALKALTDTVVATGGGYSELEGATRALIQVNSKGKLSLEELNRQFANNNIPILRLMSEAIVNDLNHPLRKYIQTASAAGGASKELSKSYQKASGGLGELNDKLAIAKQRLKEAEANTKTKESTLMGYRNTVQNLSESIAKSNQTIGQYTQAQKSAKTATTKTKLSVEEVMKLFQDPQWLAMIPIAEGQEAVISALEKSYKGASKAMEGTFLFQLGKLQDTLVLVKNALFGVNSEFENTEGSILKTLTSALIPLNNWLGKNIDNIAKWIEQLDGATVLAGAFGLAFGVFIGFFGGIVGPVLLAGAAFGTLGVIISKLIAGVRSGSVAWTMMAGAITTVGTALTAAMIVTKIQAIITAFRLLALSFGPIGLNFLMGIALIGAGIALIITNWEKAKTSSWALITVIAGLGMTIVGLLPVLLALNAALLANPIGLVIIAVALLAAGFVALYTQTDLLKTKTELVTQAQNNLKTANDNLKISTDNLKTAQDNLAGAHLSVEGAQLAVERATRNLTETLKNHSMFSLEGREAQFQLDMATQNLTTSQNNEKDAIEKVTKAQQDYTDKSAEVKESQDKLNEVNKKAKTGWDNISNAIGGAISKLQEWMDKASKATGGAIGLNKTGFGFQHGGIVPGPIGQAVPILAHGGERIIPTSGMSGGGGGTSVTINMNGNVSMDTPERVQQLADRIISIMGRQSELARYGLR